MSLLKHIYGRMDYLGENWTLKYLRTKEGQEVDFCLVKDENIITLIEVKLSDAKLSKNLFYFSDKYELKGIQLVKNLRQEQSLGRIDIRSAPTFLRELFL